MEKHVLGAAINEKASSSTASRIITGQGRAVSPRIGTATARRAYACFLQLLNLSNFPNYAPDTSRIAYYVYDIPTGDVGKERRKKWSLLAIANKATPVTRSNCLQDTTGAVPADSRQ